MNFGRIDTKKHFYEAIADFEQIAGVRFCFKNDQRRQIKGQSDPSVIEKMKEYFLTVFRDEHGQQTFKPLDFYKGLPEFFKRETDAVCFDSGMNTPGSQRSES